MNTQNEKSADIIAKMRNLGKLDEKSVDKIPRALMGLGLRTYADRLEAAIKREKAAIEAERHKPGNVAAMRAALYDIVMFTIKVGMSIHADVACGMIASKARAALAAPPRNCDVGTPEEQMERWEKFCQAHHEYQRCNCPCYKGHSCNWFIWAQMPYEEGGAK